MKTIIIESHHPLSWYFIADSALVNAGKPFFIPEFADEFEAFLAPVVRISRIGKSIASRFASRYYEEIAPAIHFRASALRRQLLEAGLPTDPSHSFDRSMIVGSFLPADTFLTGAPLIMTLTSRASSSSKHISKDKSHEAAGSIISGKYSEENPCVTVEPIMKVECTMDKLRESVGPLLESVSKSNTVKMGDFFAPFLSKPMKIKIGDILTVSKGAETLLTVNIR